MSKRSIVNIDFGGQGYEIVIGRRLMEQAGAFLASVLPSKKICVVTDAVVARLHLIAFMKALEDAAFTPTPPVILPAGEATKDFAHLQEIIDKALGFKLDRRSALVALGGGVVGDITGFAASVIMRGIPFVQVPTTLLAQVDSSVGGKTGINTPAGKNLVGAFYHPRLVLIDTDNLASLPARELRAGYAEVLKYALIDDPEFFDWLEEHGTAVLAGDAEAQVYAIDTSVRAKAAIVEDDPDETKGLRALLNLGHTFGHALEAIGGYDGRLLHGEAVSIGLQWAFDFSARLGLCPQADAARLRAHVKKVGLMAQPPFPAAADAVLARMKGDKKNRDGRLTLILAKGIGGAFVAHDIEENVLADFLRDACGGTL